MRCRPLAVAAGLGLLLLLWKGGGLEPSTLDPAGDDPLSVSARTRNDSESTPALANGPSSVAPASHDVSAENVTGHEVASPAPPRHRGGQPSRSALRMRAKAFPVRRLRQELTKRFDLGNWDTCTVVGNSGSSIGKGRGSLIDENDAVVRVNSAPAGGEHSDDVGSRTTVSVINGWKLDSCVSGANCSCWDRQYKEGSRVFVVAYSILDVHEARGDVCGASNPSNFYLLQRQGDFPKFVQSLVRHYTSEKIKRNFPREAWPKLAEERRKVKLHYSTGFLAAVLAFTLCSKVSLFGFGKADQHHYFEGETQSEVADHDYDAEMLFYAEMESGEADVAAVFYVKQVTIY